MNSKGEIFLSDHILCEMKTRKRKTRKRKSRRTLIVVSILVFLAGGLVFLALYRSNPKKKVDTKEYFEISDTFCFPYPDLNLSGILIQYLTFYLTPVKGDAHNVRITGGIQQGYVLFDKIKQGESVEVNIEYSPPYYSKKEEQGFPVIVDILSSEAEGKVQIYLKPPSI